MNQMRNILSLLLLPTVLVASTFSAGAQQQNNGNGRLFVSSFMTMHDPFFVALNDGFRRAVEAHGDRLLFLNGEHSREMQEKEVLDAFKQNPAAIFLVPATDLGSIDGIVAAAKASKVPIILVDTDLEVPDSVVLTSVLSDNLAAGRLAAKELARTNPHARIGILGFSLSRGCVDRVMGFSEEIARHPGMRILATQDGHANRDGVRGVIKDFLAAHTDMDAIFAINDASAIEALAGIEAAGLSGKIVVQGVSGSPEAIELIKSGKLLSTSAQFPADIGRIAADKAYDYLAGKPVDKVVRVPVKLITRSNVSSFDGVLK